MYIISNINKPSKPYPNGHVQSFSNMKIYHIEMERGARRKLKRKKFYLFRCSETETRPNDGVRASTTTKNSNNEHEWAKQRPACANHVGNVVLGLYTTP